MQLGDTAKYPLQLRLGRQELSYGEERMIGVSNWSNLGRTFNAVKFSIIGGLIEVSVAIIENNAHLVVKDNGNGIDASFLPSMFQRFTQEDSSSTRRHGGMGLGLALARHLVELHGGTIHAASEGLGKGATMTVSLPVWARGESQLLPHRSNAPSSNAATQNLLV